LRWSLPDLDQQLRDISQQRAGPSLCVPRTMTPCGQQSQRHGGDQAETSATADHRWAAACTTF